MGPGLCCYMHTPHQHDAGFTVLLVLLRCRVTWLSTSELATTSDDRTARIWQLPGAGTAATEAAAAAGAGCPQVLAPAQVLWGHGARVWDCQVHGGLVATAAEDCSCRLWDRATGRQLAVLQVGGAGAADADAGAAGAHVGKAAHACMLSASWAAAGSAGASSLSVPTTSSPSPVPLPTVLHEGSVDTRSVTLLQTPACKRCAERQPAAAWRRATGAAACGAAC